MSLQGMDYTQGEPLHQDLKNRLKLINVNAIPLVLLTAGLVIDLPDLIAGICIIGMALAILGALDLAFHQSRQFLAGIWVVGHTLVAGLDQIFVWVTSLFNWIDHAAMVAMQDVEQSILHTGQAITNYFTGAQQNNISNLQQQYAALSVALIQERAFSHSIASSVTYNETVTANTTAETAIQLEKSINSKIVTLQSNVEAQMKTAYDNIAVLQNNVDVINAHIVSNDVTLLQGLADLQVYAQQQIVTLVDDVATLKAAFVAETNTIATEVLKYTTRLDTLQTQVTDEGTSINFDEQAIRDLRTATQPVSGVLTQLSTLSIAAAATLMDVALDPCFCLGPIGGLATVEALIAGLEVGIL
jgi:hypothetical protein